MVAKVILATMALAIALGGIIYSLNGSRLRNQVGSDNWLARQGANARLKGKRMSPGLYVVYALILFAGIAFAIAYTLAFRRK